MSAKAAFEFADIPLDSAGALDGQQRPLIPAGKYAVEFIRHELWFYRGKRPKMTLWFRILGPSDHSGIELPRYYNLKSIKLRDGKPTGAFTFGQSSNFYRDYVNLFGPPARADRVPISAFQGEWLSAEVVDVTKDGQGGPLPESVQYSVISAIKMLEEDE